MLEKSSKGVRVAETLAAEMQEIVAAAMEPWAPGDKMKAGLNRAHRALSSAAGLSFRRVKSIHYGEPVAILAHEADRLRAWHRRHCEQEAARLRARLAEIQARQAALRERMDGLALARASAAEDFGDCVSVGVDFSAEG